MYYVFRSFKFNCFQYVDYGFTRNYRENLILLTRIKTNNGYADSHMSEIS